MTSDGDVHPALNPQSIPDPGPAAPVAKSNQAGQAIREIIETLLLAALIFFLVRLVVLNFRVDGESMTPNLHNEEMLLVNRNAYRYVDVNGADFYPFDPPSRGDVIVFDPPNRSDKPYIKRIIGLPGEHVTFGDGHVFINDQELDEDYIDQRTRCGQRDTCDVIVPEGSVYVLGDNRGNSSDSRVFGPVPLDNIIGKAWITYWPPSDIGFVPHRTYDGIASAASP
ncbi:MAG: signal peptidase I [Thermomicrobiales bacterium]